LELHGLPTGRDEPWHYFPTAVLDRLLSVAVRPRRSVSLDPRQVDLMAGGFGGDRVVFVNGVHDPGSSRTGGSEGVRVSTIGSAGAGGPAPGDVRAGTYRTDATVELNTALAVDGAVVVIDAHARHALVHVVHVTVPDREETHATFPLVRISVAEGATATVVESFVGSAGPALVDASTELVMAPRSRLAYHRVQVEGSSTTHLGRLAARLEAGSELFATSVSLGAELARTSFEVTLAGDDASVELDGLYLPSGRQHLDHTLTVHHRAHRTSSTQRFKGVIDDEARGSFTGHVIVDPRTTGTTAEQTNHNLLLSGRAEADTRPWLEILADDVSCTHGATVGRLDPEALFYLRSRGIPERAAREVLVQGFIQEIVDRVDDPDLRAHVEARITTARHRAGSTSGKGRS
jgi:Fe-S cluster assembly protein SufD